MFLKLYVTSQELMHSEEGQDLVEYALLAALISCGAVVAMHSLASGIEVGYTSISTAFANDL
jgi:Flp pilus assembly pilin Flp